MNMNLSKDSEINLRLIDLSRIVSSLLETAESAEAARERIMRSASPN